MDNIDPEYFNVDSKDPILNDLFFQIVRNAIKTEDFEINEISPEFMLSYLDKKSDEFLKEVIPEELKMLRQFRGEQNRFRKRIREIWGEGLELLELLNWISYEIGADFNQQERQNAAETNDFVFESLTHIHGRACQTSREVVVLLENGFAAGANARWRTLHELAVTAFFIKKHGQVIAERYMNHFHIDSLKGMRQYNEHIEELNYERYPDEDLEKLEQIRDQLKEKYGDEYVNDFGWASPVLLNKDGTTNKNPNFSVIEKDVEIDHLRPFYRLASHSVHAHSKGLIFNISNKLNSERVISAGSTIFGLADPGQLTAISLMQINTVLLCSRPTATRLVYAKAMQKLLQKIKDEFMKSHNRLENSQTD